MIYNETRTTGRIKSLPCIVPVDVSRLKIDIFFLWLLKCVGDDRRVLLLKFTGKTNRTRIPD